MFVLCVNIRSPFVLANEVILGFFADLSMVLGILAIERRSRRERKKKERTERMIGESTTARDLSQRSIVRALSLHTDGRRWSSAQVPQLSA